jgi:hypothetical protein
LRLTLSSGANIIVAGTAIFNADSPRDVIAFLRNRCTAAQERIAREREQILFDPAADSALDDDDDQGPTVSRPGSRPTTPLSQPRAYLRHLVARRSSGALEPMKRGNPPEGGPVKGLSAQMGMTSIG